jgi:hypothetical protein
MPRDVAVAAESDDRVLYVVEVAGRPKAAVVTAALDAGCDDLLACAAADDCPIPFQGDHRPPRRRARGR